MAIDAGSKKQHYTVLIFVNTIYVASTFWIILQHATGTQQKKAIEQMRIIRQIRTNESSLNLDGSQNDWKLFFSFLLSSSLSALLFSSSPINLFIVVELPKIGGKIVPNTKNIFTIIKRDESERFSNLTDKNKIQTNWFVC